MIHKYVSCGCGCSVIRLSYDDNDYGDDWFGVSIDIIGPPQRFRRRVKDAWHLIWGAEAPSSEVFISNPEEFLCFVDQLNDIVSELTTAGE